MLVSGDVTVFLVPGLTFDYVYSCVVEVLSGLIFISVSVLVGDGVLF